MKFQSYTLDPFQEQAIRYLQHNQTVIVSAATGTGKTLIAEYLIDTCIKKQEKRVVYTAPIKALSNQKFRDFCSQYGKEHIGMLTGDIVINPNALVLIMTTEIYRNMLLSHDPIIHDISYVVFDEIHYMNDPERGTVWEEALLFSPSSTRFLCLSATIPNADEFAAWLRTIKDHQVHVVVGKTRAVPLHHFLYHEQRVLIDRSKVQVQRKSIKSKKKKKPMQPFISPSQVIPLLKNKLPAIVFSFSRKQCEEEAVYLYKKFVFIDDFVQAQIRYVCQKHFTKEIQELSSTAQLMDVLLSGIGFHHAGLLPQQRFAVEELFSHGFLKVLFATETFAVGVNMPAKSVVLNGLRKFDGKHFRLLTAKEYFQLAGRAGRRGIDTEGFVVTLLYQRDQQLSYLQISEADTEPIQSQFQLSYNTILNLLASYSQDEINVLLRKNFYAYRKQHRQNRTIRMKTSFTQKCKQLQMMKYLNKKRELTIKGEFARKIYFEEILIGELFATDLFKKLSDLELLQVISAIVYERRPNDHFSFKGILSKYNQLCNRLWENPHFFKKLNKLSLKRMMAIVEQWAEDGSFHDVLELTSYREGDVVRLFRRIIDMLQQIIRATNDEDLALRLGTCIQLIDRDLVHFDLV
ncbi:MAG: DEAD/DEAH box helicase [Candidatus Heimdallarchaeota archaeon]|nr:DEAD/DEAH box helicase [Candidatus Heimdallarchaeota archaeon]